MISEKIKGVGRFFPFYERKFNNSICWGYHLISKEGSKYHFYDSAAKKILAVVGDDILFTSIYCLVVDGKKFTIYKINKNVPEMKYSYYIEEEIYLYKLIQGKTSLIFLVLTKSLEIIGYKLPSSKKITMHLKLSSDKNIYDLWHGADMKGIYFNEEYLTYEGRTYNFKKDFKEKVIEVSCDNQLEMLRIKTPEEYLYCEGKLGEISVKWRTKNFIQEIDNFIVAPNSVHLLKDGKNIISHENITIQGLTFNKEENGFYLWYKFSIENIPEEKYFNIERNATDEEIMESYIPKIPDYHKKYPTPVFSILSLYPYFHYIKTGEYILIPAIDPSIPNIMIIGYNKKGHRRLRAIKNVDRILEYPGMISPKNNSLFISWIRNFLNNKKYISATMKEKIEMIKKYKN